MAAWGQRQGSGTRVCERGAKPRAAARGCNGAANLATHAAMLAPEGVPLGLADAVPARGYDPMAMLLVLGGSQLCNADAAPDGGGGARRAPPWLN